MLARSRIERPSRSLRRSPARWPDRNRDWRRNRPRIGKQRRDGHDAADRTCPNGQRETDPARFLSAPYSVVDAIVQPVGSDKDLTLYLHDNPGREVKVSGQHEDMIVVRCDGYVLMSDRNAIKVHVAAAASTAANSNIAGPTLPSANINAMKQAA